MRGYYYSHHPPPPPHSVYPTQPGSSDPHPHPQNRYRHQNYVPQYAAVPAPQRILHQQDSRSHPYAQHRSGHGYWRPTLPSGTNVIDLTGEDDRPGLHRPPSLPRLTERESPYPGAELRPPKEVPRRSMTVPSSTSSGRFEELTGGRLPSPPLQKTMPILSYLTENRPFRTPSLQEKQKSPKRREAIPPPTASWNNELGAPRLGGNQSAQAKESPKSPSRGSEAGTRAARNATPSSMPTDRIRSQTNGTSRTPPASPSGSKIARKGTPTNPRPLDKVVAAQKTSAPDNPRPAEPKPEPVAVNHREPKEKISLDLETFRNLLKESIKTLHAEHEHRLKVMLGRARRSNEHGVAETENTKDDQDDSPQWKKEPSKYIQKESPFAAMEPLPNVANASPANRFHKRIKLGQFCGRSSTKPGNDASQCYDSKIYHDDSVAIPRFTTYISTRRNVLIEDNKHRTFLPYHGEEFLIGGDHDYARMEAKIIQNQKNFKHLNAISEKANFYSHYAYDLLDKVGTDITAVLYYLLDEKGVSAPSNLSTEHSIIWNNREAHITEGYYDDDDDSDSMRQRKSTSLKSTRKARPKRDWKVLFDELEEPRSYRQKVAACLACEAFLQVTEISLWHVVRQSRFAQDAEFRKSLRERKSPSSPQSDPLETYKELVCFVCKAHECPGHGEFEDEELVKNIRIRVNYKPYSPKSPSLRGLDQRMNIDRMDLDDVQPEDVLGKNEDGTISGSFWARLKEEESPYGDQDECSEDCFWLKKNRHGRTTEEWSKADSKNLEMLRPAYENDRRGSCLLAQSGMINKSCVEIFLQLLSTAPNEKLWLVRARNEAQAGGGKMPHRKGYDYWLENTGTYLLHQRQPFIPCNHLGPCNATTNCDCFRLDITCEKTCACAQNCARRFRGCQCAARGKVCRSNEKCDCWRLNRECDPDLCRTCGSHEVLDPANRYNREATAGKCLNVHIQRGVPKRTLLGHSKMMLSGNKQGWGLYMGETCKRGEYIGEYVGEIVTRREAEQRGTIYDKRNMSYLFDLNDSQTLDSTFVGNKHRFINHQREPFVNCSARTMFCNHVQRIGMFASKDIEIGEEMFFDYGEGFASKFDLIKMNAEGPPTIQKPIEPFFSRKLYRQHKCTLSKNGIRIGRPPKWNDTNPKDSPESGKRAKKRRHSVAIYDGPGDSMDEDMDENDSDESDEDEDLSGMEIAEVEEVVRDSNDSDSGSDSSDDDDEDSSDEEGEESDEEEVVTRRRRRRGGLLGLPRKGSRGGRRGGGIGRLAPRSGSKGISFETPQKRGWRTRQQNLAMAAARGENVNKRGKLPGSLKKLKKRRGYGKRGGRGGSRRF